MPKNDTISTKLVVKWAQLAVIDGKTSEIIHYLLIIYYYNTRKQYQNNFEWCLNANGQI